MSHRDLVDLYVRCYPGVRNEISMRSSAGSINGRFVRDDQVVNGALHAAAWLVFAREEPVLHFPETHGRRVTVTLYDVWNNVRSVFTVPGYYKLAIPGATAGILMASVDCRNPSDEQEYQMAYDVMQDLVINDIKLGTNDYSDFVSVAPTASNLQVVSPEEMSGKEFFAIASALHNFNPFPTQRARDAALLAKTMTVPAADLDRAKNAALARMKIL